MIPKVRAANHETSGGVASTLAGEFVNQTLTILQDDGSDLDVRLNTPDRGSSMKMGKRDGIVLLAGVALIVLGIGVRYAHADNLQCISEEPGCFTGCTDFGYPTFCENPPPAANGYWTSYITLGYIVGHCDDGGTGCNGSYRTNCISQFTTGSADDPCSEALCGSGTSEMTYGCRRPQP